MTTSNQSVPSMFNFASPECWSLSTMTMWSLQVRARTVSPFGREYIMARPKLGCFVSSFPFCLVPDMVMQRILRHANVSTTATYYIKTAVVDVRNAKTKLENHIAEADRIRSDTNGTLDSKSNVAPSTIQ
jgi:hypothetical protein